MDTTLHIKNKTNFVQKFLQPIAKISDNAVIKIGKTVNNLITSADRNVILYAQTDAANSEIECKLNIADIKKFIKLIDCIGHEEFVVNVRNNHLEYKSTEVKFKFHLLDDGIIKEPTINLQKILDFEIETKFNLTSEKYSALIKGSAIINDCNKIYIFTENGKVIGELSDRTQQNTDSFGQIISESYEGVDITQALPVSFEVFRSLTFKTDYADFGINKTKGASIIDIKDGNNTLKYIATALLK
tara:strand:- start:179 stop:910 length:732 start_codon:yes stop_codon:yes gene_type:complete